MKLSQELRTGQFVFFLLVYDNEGYLMTLLLLATSKQNLPLVFAIW